MIIYPFLIGLGVRGFDMTATILVLTEPKAYE